jgi:ABC-2 type transport system ATP-binding protein
MLDICDLTKRYGEVVALDGASFSVAPGRIVGFLGPNGAGETATLRTIFGLVRPDRARCAGGADRSDPGSGLASATCQRNAGSTRR